MPNLYPGVNPHLNSFLQKDLASWESFHADFVLRIRGILEGALPAGYVGVMEKSLQLRDILPDTSRPDVINYHNRSHITEPTLPTVTPSTASLPLTASFPHEHSLSAITIYQIGEGSGFGRPITQIEVLSINSKFGGSHYSYYIGKRADALHKGLRLVEIDFLHETRPIISHLPSYADHERDAYPYTIVVSDPRPEFEKGRVSIYGMRIDGTLPRIRLPLAGVDYHVMDLGIAYNRAYESLAFVQTAVDYATTPVNFGRYTEADRQWIQLQMARIANLP